MNAEIVHPRNLIPIHPGDTVIETISSFSIIIFLTSHIAEIKGKFANMLMVGMEPDNASRVKEVA